jgi:hypothetical protein
MGRRIKLITRRELTVAIRLRYQAAERNSKKIILDEFVKVTGYHRKHAIRILTTESGGQPKRQVGHRIYQEAVKEALIVLWEASDRICGKRLKASLPLLVMAMERHGHLQLDDSVKKQLLAMSAATIDRLLRTVREHAFWRPQEEGRSGYPRRQVGSGSHVRGLGRSWTRLPGDRSGRALRDQTSRQLCAFSGLDGHSVGMDRVRASSGSRTDTHR